MGFTRTNKGCTPDSSPDPPPGDQDKDASTTSAELVAILIPAIGGSVLTLFLALLCCVWANKAQTRLRKDIEKELPEYQEKEDKVVLANGHAKNGLEFVSFRPLLLDPTLAWTLDCPNNTVLAGILCNSQLNFKKMFK